MSGPRFSSDLGSVASGEGNDPGLGAARLTEIEARAKNADHAWPSNHAAYMPEPCSEILTEWLYPLAEDALWLLALVRDLERERDDARETAKRLNRRVTQAEAGVSQTIEDCERQGVSIGRGLANVGYGSMKRRAEAAERELADARAENEELRDALLDIGYADDGREGVKPTRKALMMLARAALVNAGVPASPEGGAK